MSARSTTLTFISSTQEAFEKCRAHSPLRAAARPNFTLPFTRRRYCPTPPAHRCPRQRQRQQRQRVTGGPLWLHRMGPMIAIFETIRATFVENLRTRRLDGQEEIATISRIRLFQNAPATSLTKVARRLFEAS